ncbi:high-affinity Fe2+/Pb2+ permease [Microbacteriaceae bacterium SG_E_30_P1]|uniref:High-affinity Fe2+/Pb2+ permease n=1 Tax=Antiquaquibacter oligotrophicus TaxID=2880260 RepID=A0ABT6KP52_9MICO|nr:hypothetical protein [Antiquaquibacter oligotrophicus]MDH6181639.1 high-affinity Fe2+/Pb2+ permease [Antiquaquibacter oligotrophicus]UDF12677.1 hypothetical protein LH407_10995 [Antiquaquibacter oligotrophicus]
MSETSNDPTRIREQPSLTSSTGTIWLIVGGLLSVVSIVVLSLLTSLEGAALIGVAIVVALYAAIVVTRFVVPVGRRRLAIMAACMLAIAAVSLIFVGVIAATEWEPLGT